MIFGESRGDSARSLVLEIARTSPIPKWVLVTETLTQLLGRAAQAFHWQAYSAVLPVSSRSRLTVSEGECLLVLSNILFE